MHTIELLFVYPSVLASGHCYRKRPAVLSALSMMPNMRNALLYPLLVAACAGIAFCTEHSAATIKSKPALPIVVNTWPFVNATRVAYRTLTQKPDASAIDAVEQVQHAALYQLLRFMRLPFIFSFRVAVNASAIAAMEA